MPSPPCPELDCPRCRSRMRAAIRPGPSGAFRIGAFPLRCPRCGARASFASPRHAVPAASP